jgi:hypothetical protein
MNLLTLYGKEIFALTVPVFTLIINKFFKNSAKVCYGVLHQFTYLINEPLRNANNEVICNTQIVHTYSYVFKNEGKEPATNVEIIFNYSPMYLNIWPSRHYTVKEGAEGRYIMVMDYLAPQEFVRCEMMSINKDLPELLSVRCKEGLAKEIKMMPNKVLPPIYLRFVLLLIFLGSVTLIYLVIVVLQWLVLRTG